MVLCGYGEDSLSLKHLGVVVKTFWGSSVTIFPQTVGCVSHSRCPVLWCPVPRESSVTVLSSHWTSTTQVSCSVPPRPASCPPGLPELSPKWHLDQQTGMCALQETFGDPQEMIMIYSFFLRAVLIKCPTTQGSYVIAFVCWIMAEDLCLHEHAPVSAAAFCSASTSCGEKKLGKKWNNTLKITEEIKNPYFTFNKSHDFF